MILGFQPQFIEAIEAGRKKHTIRRGNRWTVGMKAHLYERARQKGMRLILKSEVIKVEPILILVTTDSMTVRIEGMDLDKDEREQLARRDGFENFEQMHRFWRRAHGYGYFEGQVIHWK